MTKKHEIEIQEIEQQFDLELKSKEAEWISKFEDKHYKSKDAEELEIRLDIAKSRELWDDALTIEKQLKVINQRDEKNSQMKNRKLIDEKIKKLKLSQKRQLEKERSERNKS